MVIKIVMKNSQLLDKNDDNGNDGGDDIFCEAGNTFLSHEREAFQMRMLGKAMVMIKMMVMPM